MTPRMRWTTRDGAFILNWLDHRQIKGLGYYDTVVEASKDHNGISRSLDSIKRHVRGIAQKCRKTDIDGSIFDLGTSCLDQTALCEHSQRSDDYDRGLSRVTLSEPAPSDARSQVMEDSRETRRTRQVYW